MEQSLANDKDYFIKLQRNMNENDDKNIATYDNVCNLQKLMILTHCFSSLGLLLTRFYRIRLNESISKSHSFMWNDDLKGSVKSTFKERGLPFIYSPLIPSLTSNSYCAYCHEYDSTDDEFLLPLCSHYVGTYNGPNLPLVTN